MRSLRCPLFISVSFAQQAAQVCTYPYHSFGTIGKEIPCFLLDIAPSASSLAMVFERQLTLQNAFSPL